MSESAGPSHRTAAFVFGGFDSPTTTQVPDAFFDVVAPELSEAELRVALYIIRRTFGFKKDSDTISLRQMVHGITTKDGRVLDRGTGLKKSAVANALNGLERKGVILSQRNRSAERGNEPTTYALNIKNHPLSTGTDKGLSIYTDKGLSVPVDTQYTEIQETVEQHTDRNSNRFDGIANMRHSGTRSVLSKQTRSLAMSQQIEPVAEAPFGAGAERTNGLTPIGQIIERRGRKRSGDTLQRPRKALKTAVDPETRPNSQAASYRADDGPKRGRRQRGRPPKLSPYLEDLVDRYSEELHDEDHQPQNRGQAGRLWKASGWGESAFGQALHEAKAITLKHDIRKQATVGGEVGARNKMPYFFKVLRDLLGLKDSDGSREGVAT